MERDEHDSGHSQNHGTQHNSNNESWRPNLSLNQSFQPGKAGHGNSSKWYKFFHGKMMPGFWYKLSRNQKIGAVVAVVLILGLAGMAVYNNFVSTSEGGVSYTKSTPKKVAKSNTVASPLTGVQVSPDSAKRPVTGIMIENSTDARPQSGIQDAGVIFEAIAEGGITRFLTLYQEGQPQYVGPVRSLRPYYIDWAKGFDAPIAHVGGSPDALNQIRNGGKDLDQFFNAGSYTRISSRAAPHNVYTSFDNMDKLNQSKGYTSSTFTSWKRKADSKIATPTAKSINLAISGPLYNVHYDYDPVTNLYLRHEGGQPHTMLVSAGDKTTYQLRPKVVIGMVIRYGINSDGHHSDYDTLAGGTAYIFQDGGVTIGSWSKADAASQIKFTDSAGTEIALNAGQTWVTAVQDGQVSYTP